MDQAGFLAIIDSGVDIDHPDLVKNIWTNPREIPGNGLDDDGNGYPHDVNGWNFGDKTPTAKKISMERTWQASQLRLETMGSALVALPGTPELCHLTYLAVVDCQTRIS